MTVVVELDGIEEEDDLPIPLCSAVKILGAPLQFVPEGGHQPALTEWLLQPFYPLPPSPVEWMANN